jgi:hypothetical protein
LLESLRQYVSDEKNIERHLSLIIKHGNADSLALNVRLWPNVVKRHANALLSEAMKEFYPKTIIEALMKIVDVRNFIISVPGSKVLDSATDVGLAVLTEFLVKHDLARPILKDLAVEYETFLATSPDKVKKAVDLIEPLKQAHFVIAQSFNFVQFSWFVLLYYPSLLTEFAETLSTKLANRHATIQASRKRSIWNDPLDFDLTDAVRIKFGQVAILSDSVSFLRLSQPVTITADFAVEIDFTIDSRSGTSLDFAVEMVGKDGRRK